MHKFVVKVVPAILFFVIAVALLAIPLWWPLQASHAQQPSITSSITPTPTYETGSIASEVSPAIQTAATSISCLDEQESKMVELINAFRREHHLNTLSISFPLSKAAQFHSQAMAKTNIMDHQLPDGRAPWDVAESFGYPASAGMAENLAASSSQAQPMFEQWLNSPGHRDNLLKSEMTAIGVGRAFDGASTWDWWWTADLGTSSDSASSC